MVIVLLIKIYYLYCVSHINSVNVKEYLIPTGVIVGTGLILYNIKDKKIVKKNKLVKKKKRFSSSSSKTTEEEVLDGSPVSNAHEERNVYEESERVFVNRDEETSEFKIDSNHEKYENNSSPNSMPISDFFKETTQKRVRKEGNREEEGQEEQEREQYKKAIEGLKKIYDKHFEEKTITEMFEKIYSDQNFLSELIKEITKFTSDNYLRVSKDEYSLIEDIRDYMKNKHENKKFYNNLDFYNSKYLKKYFIILLGENKLTKQDSEEFKNNLYLILKSVLKNKYNQDSQNYPIGLDYITKKLIAYMLDKYKIKETTYIIDGKEFQDQDIILK